MRCWGAVILSVTCLAISAGAQAADCDANDPTLLKPDLIAEPPTHVRVLSRLGHRVVIFSTTIAKGKFRFGVILEWILSNVKPLPD